MRPQLGRSYRLMGLVCLACCGMAARADGQGAELRAAFAKGEELRTQGKAAEAIPHLETAVRLAPSVFGADGADTATIQLALANSYRDMSRYADAEPLYQRSLRIREAKFGASDMKVAEVINSLANLYLYQAKYAEALPLYERSLRIGELKLGPQHLFAGKVLSNLAIVHEKLGHYQDAEALYLRSLRVKESQAQRDEISESYTWYSLANLYSTQGRYGEAETYYKKSLATKEAKLGRDHIDVAMTLNDLGNLYDKQGRYAEAEAQHLRSLAIREKRLGPNHPDLAMSLVNLAGVNKNLGRYAPAERFYQRAIPIQEARLGKDHPDVASAVHGLALVSLRLGQHERVEPLLQRALKIREAKFGPQHRSVAESLDGLGNYFRIIGEFQKAEAPVLKSISLFEANLGPDHPYVGTAHANLGLIYAGQQRYDDAERAFQKALRIIEAKHGPNHPDVATSLRYLGIIEWARGRNPQADQLLRRCLTIQESLLGTDHPDVAATLHQLALVAAADDRWIDAAAQVDRSRRLVRKHAAQILPALSEYEQLTYLKNIDRQRFEVAISVGVKRSEDPAIVAQSAAWVLNGKAMTQQVLVERAYQTRAFKEAVAAQLSEQLSNVRKQLAEWLTSSDPATTERRRQIEQLKQQERSQAQQLDQALGRSQRLDPWVELSEVRERIPSDGLLVEILRINVKNFRGGMPDPGEHYVVWLIPTAGQEVPTLVDLGPVEPIDAAVKQVRSQLANAGESIRSQGEQAAEKELRPALDQLAVLVLQPLSASLKSKTRWIISPDSSLWLVPWEALPWDDGYATEQHAISYVVSGRDLVLTPPQHPKVNAPMIMANPDFDLGIAQTKAETERIITETQNRGLLKVPTRSLNLGKVQRLPGTAQEAEAVRPNLQKYTGVAPLVYTDKHALEGVFKIFARPQVAVLSTHGFFQEDQVAQTSSLSSVTGSSSLTKDLSGQPLENPLLRCGLLLAGVNQRAISNNPEIDDGVLTGIEIVSADLRGTKLVVLSACETGLGEVRNGEGVAGLRQAFQLAGAQTVAATLWQIPDVESVRLMSDFFESLAQGHPPGDALRESQIKQIEARRGRFGAAHPFFWAAYTLTGKPGK